MDWRRIGVSGSLRDNRPAAKVLIVGATSAIAEATARRYAGRGAHLYLLGRDPARLEAMAADLAVRGAASTGTGRFEAGQVGHHGELIDRAAQVLGRIDVALVAFGTLPDQERAEENIEVALSALAINGTDTVSVILHLANRLEKQGSGTLAVITSVAGDRGRRSNYLYGGAKRMVSTVLDGLRIRLDPSGVSVVDIRPGLVDTPMTDGFEKGLLWANPDAVARRIVNAVDAGDRVTYAPWFWAPVMMLIRAIPSPIFRRLPL